eukprot:TRINITY_DN13021_c0_g1_i6.p1 TRINITY_DN13021_c0_g1~~TRINITY_DN13021_c0_g1_i6.p1  ORF type:complete len:163 (+),score=30.45 TRINITY_DN13021_c0_g1_i6:185-673(+)
MCIRDRVSTQSTWVSTLSQMKIFVRNFCKLESKTQSIGDLQSIISCVEKSFEYIQKLQSLTLLYRKNILDPLIQEAIQNLSLDNTFSTTQKEKFALLYTPKLDNLPLLEISGPHEREYILTYLNYSGVIPSPCRICLLYTSDAADDTPCVDLGGRRIIKKKK